MVRPELSLSSRALICVHLKHLLTWWWNQVEHKATARGSGVSLVLMSTYYRHFHTSLLYFG